MANFNRKVMSLFKKNRAQLIKETRRRGITFENTEQAIAEIIWKDAYDAGVNDGKHSLTRSQIAPTKMYCFHDITEDIKYRLKLTDGQVRVIEWMIDSEFITNVELFEWYDTFNDVGGI